MFYQPSIDRKYYFAYGGKFETDNTMRGFTCITFIGAVCGVDPSSGAMGAYGTQLANHLAATMCDMENKKESDIITLCHETSSSMGKVRGLVLDWRSDRGSGTD